MSKIYQTSYRSNNIEIINSAFTCKLVINGKVADVFWGLFGHPPRLLQGRVRIDERDYHIKAVLGIKFIGVQCAIFVDDELIFTTCEILPTA